MRTSAIPDCAAVITNFASAAESWPLASPRLVIPATPAAPLAEFPDDPISASCCAQPANNAHTLRMINSFFIITSFVDSSGRLLGPFVGQTFRELRQLLVRRFLFFHILLEQVQRFTVPHPLGPGAQGSVTRYLVMLHLLLARNQRRIHCLGAFMLLHHFFALLNQSLHSLACLALRRLAQRSKYLVQTRELLRRLL